MRVFLKENRFLDLKCFPPGVRIKLLLIASGQTSFWLAKALGVQSDVMSKIIRGMMPLSPKRLNAASKRLGINPEVLQDDQDKSSCSSHEMY